MERFFSSDCWEGKHSELGTAGSQEVQNRETVSDVLVVRAFG
jgi:hypothetical protein